MPDPTAAPAASPGTPAAPLDPAADAALSGALEAILAEAERHAAWTAELETELDSARQRRAQLAAALDRLIAALGPGGRGYLPRVAAIAGEAPWRPPGKPAPDGRLAALKRLLADWPEETVTPLAATRALRALGLEVPKNYVANRFFGMVPRGVVLRIAPGRYRIARTHPEMLEAGAARTP